MLKQAVKRILALLLALMFMLISAVSFADNNSGKDSNDNEDRNSDYGIAVDSNGHVYPEYFSGIANDMLSKLKELLSQKRLRLTARVYRLILRQPLHRMILRRIALAGSL